MSNSLIIRVADDNKVPAGTALAVDRVKFSQSIDKIIKNDPNINYINQEINSLEQFKNNIVVIETGPLTSHKLANEIIKLTNINSLDFFDAIAPIIYKDSINMKVAWKQSRYNKGEGDDYINCPLNEDQYKNLISLVEASPKIEFKEFEHTPFFESCLPIEEMIRRGPETLRFGPMKPVGLNNPNSELKPYAVVQLRQDNALGSLYNMVGFQTKMTYKSQKEVFKNIPGLEKAEFARLGGMHRNTFINSPKLLDNFLRLKRNHNIYFAGQITGVEGYVESAAIGNLVGRIINKLVNQRKFVLPPKNTAHGALLAHLTKLANPKTFQPMNVNFGLFDTKNDPDLIKKKGKDRKKIISQKALNSFKNWINNSDHNYY